MACRHGVMAAGLLYALITNFLGAKHPYEPDDLILTNSHTSQKQFGFGHLALFTTFIRPGMGMQGSDKQFTKTDQRGGRLLITFCLLLAGDVHQCPGPMFHTEFATKSSKPDTTSQSSGLQIRSAVNVVQKSPDHPPKFCACSSDGSRSVLAAVAARAGSRGMFGMEEGSFRAALNQLTSVRRTPLFPSTLSMVQVSVGQSRIHVE